VEDRPLSGEIEDFGISGLENSVTEPEDFKKPFAKKNGKKRRSGSFQQKKSH